ncbi:ATP-binding protein [Pseudalkalibacillus sp. Hm43]|uniref:ATP-binding protein n=1 Tax=Pseudalkalibacillus sp. Hm43 TaxID=3450742 RepID=UPI003F42BB86
MDNKVMIVPSASRLTESLRDIGYDIPTSIADLVDNSIEAKATEIWIDVEYIGIHSYISISDNGVGMSANEIDEALRYGSNSNYNEKSLGKFGLGLKTASLSHCKKITIASKNQYEEINTLCWDLDHINKSDKWEALKLSENEFNEIILERLNSNNGTVVVWENLDRILYKDEDSILTQREFAGICRQIEEHIGMVFHRFISGTNVPKVNIYINGNLIQAWDPFVVDEPCTKAIDTSILKFKDSSNSEINVKVRPYILPHESQFSSKQAHAKAAGPKKWNRQQGLYIYRNNRLIQSGGWNRLRAADEHTKLARLAIDFDSRADNAFQINISKMKVKIPNVIRGELLEIAKKVSAKANEVYRNKGDSKRPPQKAKLPPKKHPRKEPGLEIKTKPKKNSSTQILHSNKDLDNTIIKILDIIKQELSEEEYLLNKILSRLSNIDEIKKLQERGKNNE